MTEQQYRVIADRDKGDDMAAPTQQGDRLTWEWTDKHVVGDLRHDELVRIERPVPTTDEPAADEVIIDGNVFNRADLPDLLKRHMRALDDAQRREKQHWIDCHEPVPHPPTREQIDTAVGEVLFNASNYPKPAVHHIAGQDVAPLRSKVTDAVFALIQGGAR